MDMTKARASQEESAIDLLQGSKLISERVLQESSEPIDDVLGLESNTKGRRFRSNDPRVIISNAKREQELLEKKLKIKQDK